MYGPINKLLSMLLGDSFMLKPQGPLRHLLPEIPLPDEPRTSIDSYNNEVYPRRGKNPDFILCEFSETLNDDRMIAIIEVKLKGDMQGAVAQLAQYLDLPDVAVPGIAVAGNEVLVIERNQAGGFQLVHQFSLLSQAFRYYLSGLVTL